MTWGIGGDCALLYAYARGVAVDPSYRASRETHSPVPCGAGLRAVDLGSCTGRRQGLLRPARRFLSQVCPEYEPTRRRRGVGSGRRLPERQSSDGHTGVGGQVASGRLFAAEGIYALATASAPQPRSKKWSDADVDSVVPTGAERSEA